MNTKSDSEKIADIVTPWLLVFIYAFLVMIVWNWFSSFLSIPKMDYWMAVAIYLLLSRVVRK